MTDRSTSAQVLVIDDDQAIRRLVVATLERYGYGTVAVSSAEEGLEVARAESFAAVLVDLCMPGMGGHGFVRAFRKLSPDLPVILMSGQAEIGDVVVGFREGVTDFLVKPFTPADVATTLSRILRNTGDGGQSDYGQARQSSDRFSANRPSHLGAQNAVPPPEMAHDGSLPSPSGTDFIERLKRELEVKHISIPMPQSFLAQVSERLTDPTLDTRQLAALLERVPQAAARVLQRAQTAFYGVRCERTPTLFEAIQRLGVETGVALTRTAILQSTIAIPAGRHSALAHKMWENMIGTAAIAQVMATHRKLLSPAEAYLIALFHNVGELLILRLCADMETGGGDDVTEADLLQAILDHHTDLGYVLCRAWRLDELTCNVARWHHNGEVYRSEYEDASLARVCALCALSHLMAIEVNGSYLRTQTDTPSGEQCRQLLGIAQSEIPVLLGEGKRVITSMATVFSGPVAPQDIRG